MNSPRFRRALRTLAGLYLTAATALALVSRMPEVLTDHLWIAGYALPHSLAFGVAAGWFAVAVALALWAHRGAKTENRSSDSSRRSVVRSLGRPMSSLAALLLLTGFVGSVGPVEVPSHCTDSEGSPSASQAFRSAVAAFRGRRTPPMGAASTSEPSFPAAIVELGVGVESGLQG